MTVIASDPERSGGERSNLDLKRDCFARYRSLAMTLSLFILISGCTLFRPATPPLPKLPWAEIQAQIHLKGPSPLTAGAARVEITPPVGTPLAGYAKRRGRPSVGVRDPLYVRVLALSDGQDQVILVSSDLLIFPHPMAEELVDKISGEFHLPRQAIVLAATHTHSGAGSIAPGPLYEMVFGSYRSQVVEGIIGRVLWAIRQAMERRQPVRCGSIRSENGLEGLTENRMIPSGPADPSVGLFLVESQAGKPLAVLVNAAAHPTLMDSQEMRFSADYPGELARIVEETYPGSVCLFMNGADGDLRPKDAIGSTPDERIARFGGALAEISAGLIGRVSLSGKGDLAAWGWESSLPLPQIYLGPVPIHPEIGRWMKPTSTYLSLIALDRTLFVPLPAELTSEVGASLRKKLAEKGNNPFLLVYANGYLGYTVTPEEYKTRSYEAWMTWYGPEFGQFLIDRLERLAKLYSKDS